jgi:RNA polymerase sigma-70 factor (ECF subfamily)
MSDAGSDARIHDLLVARDFAAAATEALRRLGPPVLRYMRFVLRDEAAAGDAFSQWCENFWKGIRSYRGACSLRTWALRLAHNVVSNQREEHWRRHVRRFATGEASRLADEIRTSRAARFERQRRALDVLRDALTAEERSLLTLRIDQELSWAEIAAVLSTHGRAVEPDALMKRFERIKARLAVLARERGLVEDVPRDSRPAGDQ